MFRLITTFALAGVFTLGATSAAAAPTERSAERFAEEHFESIVLDHIEGDDPSNYHLTESRTVSFGPLHEVLIAAQSCYSLDEMCTFVSSKEYVSAVLQDGEPRNVIGTWEQEPGIFAFSTFGYGDELAIALADVSGSLVHSAQENAWFDLNGETLTAMTTDAKRFIGGDTITLEMYQKLLVETHSNDQGSVEDAPTGGSGDVQTIEPKSFRMIGLALLTGLPLGYLFYRRRWKR
ncbi:hypothetical protein EVJ30_12340 [Exiguobacterium sp. SH5S13]|uniref:hypothetical protein n=1 Tax=Exiguobacterium sp. SH5S13 TaxID=2510959 RepID=UPI00103F7FE4|nr:hypothetical protein [Exiguobacterium sp. SH5S13]TCI50849.1 hypothetical protein EVJ30_12340 [Exiguobacterium sp. SH5S13]